MKTSKTAPWVLGTVLIAVVVLAIAWFLAISPQLDAATEARDQEVAAQERNDMLEIQNAGLAKDFAKIDTYKDEISALQVKVPSTVEQAALNRELGDISASTGAFIVEITSGTAVPATPTTNGAPVQAVGPAVAAPAGAFAVPMTVTILGDPLEIMAYIGALQRDTARAFLVSGISLAGQDAAGASGGKPEIFDGDAEVVITGYAYVFDPAAAPAAPAPAAGTAEAPATAN